MKRFLLISVLLAPALSSCTDADNAMRVLSAHGLKDVQTTGYRFWGCSEDDSFHTGFEATGLNGERVSGVVCSGWFFKNSTIRFD